MFACMSKPLPLDYVSYFIKEKKKDNIAIYRKSMLISVLKTIIKENKTDSTYIRK